MNRMEWIAEKERRKAVCLELFEDYRQSLLAYAEWMDDFRSRTDRVHPFLPLRQQEAGK